MQATQSWLSSDNATLRTHPPLLSIPPLVVLELEVLDVNKSQQPWHPLMVSRAKQQNIEFVHKLHIAIG